MAQNIDKTTQFDTFNTIKNIILNDSILNKKFDAGNILEYEPSKNNFELPHIVVKVPSFEQDERTVGGSPIIMSNIGVEINIKVGYEARDRFRGYWNALKAALEADVTLEVLGYIPEGVDADTPDTDTIFEKTVIVGDMVFNLNGATN
jgi:hypothetical protein